MEYIFIVLALIMLIFYGIKLNRNAQLNDFVLNSIYDAKNENSLLLININKNKSELAQLIDHNKHVIELNKQVLKKNELNLFHAKETTLCLYLHYKSIMDLLNVVKNDFPDKKTANLFHDTMNNYKIVEGYFINTFKVHPEDYIRSKKNITGRNGMGNDIILHHGIN